MKAFIQRILQKVFGFELYLFVFSVFKIYTLRWDKGEKDFFHFLSLIPSNKVTLDVGANIGIMAYHLSRNHPKSDLIAIEPVRENLNTLKKIKKFFSLVNLRIEPVAVGNEERMMEMVMPEENGVRKQGLSHSSEVDNKVEGHRYEVPLKRLDDLIDFQNYPIGAIKLDVENYELQALKGAEELLKSCSPILYCELWDNQNRYDCFEFMQQLKYKVQVVMGNGLVDFDDNIHSTQNFFFVPNS